MANYSADGNTDEHELLYAEFKDGVTEEIEIYKKNYAEYMNEQGFSFNEGFLFMKLTFMQNCIDQLAGTTFAIEETINPEDDDG